MTLVYVACLLAGAGVILAQLALGHDAAAGHDVHHGDGDHDLTAWTVVASVRFWSFALMAFGLVGSLLGFFSLASAIATFALAAITGVGSGVTAVVVIRRLLDRSPQSTASYGELRGSVGRVVVPISASSAGKVRVDVRGTAVDVVARAREPIDVGEAVVVEEVSSEGDALVGRAPRELRG